MVSLRLFEPPIRRRGTFQSLRPGRSRPQRVVGLQPSNQRRTPCRPPVRGRTARWQRCVSTYMGQLDPRERSRGSGIKNGRHPKKDVSRSQSPEMARWSGLCGWRRAGGARWWSASVSRSNRSRTALN